MNKNLFDLSGKNALVTGSSRGLGWALASTLAAYGARVVINGTNAETVTQRVKELEQQGYGALAAPFDITNEDAVKSGIE